LSLPTRLPVDTLFDLFTHRLASPWWEQVKAYAPWMLLVFVLERLLRARQPDAAAVWFNLRFIGIGIAISLLQVAAGWQLAQPVVTPLAAWFAPWRAAVQQVPAWLQMLLQVAVLDFFYYWTHRAQHRFAPLWRIHELHHSDPSFNVTTTLRVHWLEDLMKLATVLIPASLLVQAPAGVPLVLGWIGAAWLFFIHANARISFGPLNRVLVSPAVHRVHHSVQPEHHDKNFAAYFSFWDVLFGTYAAPSAGQWPAVGTAGTPPATVWAAQWRPFRRAQAGERWPD